MGISCSSKTIKCVAVYSGMFFAAATASADTAQIPNTFVSGHAAVAQDVNDNFTALKNAVDGNAARLPVLKDSSGEIKGTVITFLGSNITLMSEKNYMINISSPTGELYNNYLHYVSNDCSGNPYNANIQSVVTDGTNYFYIPKGASPVDVTINSSMADKGGCTTFTMSMKLYATLVNDPLVTGIESAPLSTPLIIETR